MSGLRCCGPTHILPLECSKLINGGKRTEIGGQRQDGLQLDIPGIQITKAPYMQNLRKINSVIKKKKWGGFLGLALEQ